MKKNRGMTLIELIIVITILAVLMGLVIPSLNALLGYEAQKATEKLSASMEGARTEAMSRLAGEILIYKKDNNYYTQTCYSSGKSDGYRMLLQEPEQIGNRRVTISYEEKGKEGIWNPIDETGIRLAYNRTTGGFRMLQSDWASVASDTLKVAFHDTGKYCTKIKIVGGMRTKIFTLNIETGTFVVEKGA